VKVNGKRELRFIQTILKMNAWQSKSLTLYSIKNEFEEDMIGPRFITERGDKTISRVGFFRLATVDLKKFTMAPSKPDEFYPFTKVP